MKSTLSSDTVASEILCLSSRRLNGAKARPFLSAANILLITKPQNTTLIPLNAAKKTCGKGLANDHLDPGLRMRSARSERRAGGYDTMVVADCYHRSDSCGHGG